RRTATTDNRQPPIVDGAGERIDRRTRRQAQHQNEANDRANVARRALRFLHASGGDDPEETSSTTRRRADHD
ncbi:MAG: hypothetical protein BRD46_04685, partial [Bacteroidetes bacterium QS_8_68_15]